MSKLKRILRAHAGFTLVELLVGMMVGLIGIVVISQMYVASEGRKRSASGGSDAQVAGNLSMFSIERALRMAGYGLSNTLLLGCNTLAYNSARTTADFSFSIGPVTIEPNADGNSDRVTVMYSGSAGVALLDGNQFNASAASGGIFPMKTAVGYTIGDLVLAAESGKSCSLAEITGFSTNDIQHTGGTYNKAGGLGVAYTSDAFLFNLGRKAYDSANANLSPFTVQRWRVSANRLNMESLIPYVAAADSNADDWSDYPLASGVAQMKALYGTDDGADNGTVPNTVFAPDDGIIDNWNTTAVTSATGWRRTRAVRIALLVRGGQYEKDIVTAAAPRWNDSATAFVMANLADGTDWRHYRYRVYEVDVPLRNIIWTP